MLRHVATAALLAGGAAAHGLADAGVGSGWTRPPPPPGVMVRDVDYTVDGATYEGFLALPDSKTPKKGGLLIAHQYMGLIDYEKARAAEFAGMGYTAFAIDVYGKGVRCNTSACASSTMNKAKSDIPKLRGLISAGTQQLLQHAPDKGQLVAMGYCFGGSMVLELARHPGKGASDGVTFKAVSSIHGTLDAYSGETAAQGEVHTRIQAHHAELDFQGDGALTALEAELKGGVNGTDAVWETLKYSKCSHGWTEPGTPIYRARAAVQAHKSTAEFFQMALGEEDPEADAFPITPFCTSA